MTEGNQFLKEQLKKSVKEYLNIDDEIKTLLRATKERRNRKKVLQEFILNIMEQHELTHMNLKDGRLVYKKTNNLVPINKQHLETSLTNYFDDELRGTEITNYLWKNRRRKEKTRLHRTKNRKKREKKIDID